MARIFTALAASLALTFLSILLFFYIGRNSLTASTFFDPSYDMTYSNIPPQKDGDIKGDHPKDDQPHFNRSNPDLIELAIKDTIRAHGGYKKNRPSRSKNINNDENERRQ